MTWEKQRVLAILQRMLDVSPERHSVEMLRAEMDPLIQSIVKDHIHEKRLDIRALVEKNDYEARLNRIKNQYSLAQVMDTDSESDEYKKPKKRPGRKPKKQTPQKRDFDEAFSSPTQPNSLRPGRKPKHQKLNPNSSSPVASTSHPVFDQIEEYKRQEKDLSTINDAQTLESIAELEHKHIEVLEAKYNELKDNQEVSHQIGLEIQRKRGRILKLVEKLESFV